MPVQARQMWEAGGKLYYSQAQAEYAEAKTALGNILAEKFHANQERKALVQLFEMLLEPGPLRPALVEYLNTIELLPVGAEGYPKEGHSVVHPATSMPVVAPVRRRAINTGERQGADTAADTEEYRAKSFDEERDEADRKIVSAWDGAEDGSDPAPVGSIQKRRSGL